MKVLNSEKLAELNVAFRDAYTRGLAANPSLPSEAITTAELGMPPIPSTNKTMRHAWLSFLTGWREWVDERVIGQLLAGNYAVSDRKFEWTVGVDREQWEDDQLGQFMMTFEMRGAQSQLLPRELMIAALIANGTWADGKAFFAADRTMGNSGTINNVTNSALTGTTFEAGMTAMIEAKGPDGKILGVVPRYLVVGSKLRTTGWGLVNDKLVSAGTGKGGATENPNYKRVELRILPELTGTYDDYWYILGETFGIKPVAYQERIKPTMEPSDQNSFMKDQLLWGGRARGEGFLTLPQTAYAGIL